MSLFIRMGHSYVEESIGEPRGASLRLLVIYFGSQFILADALRTAEILHQDRIIIVQNYAMETL